MNMLSSKLPGVCFTSSKDTIEDVQAAVMEINVSTHFIVEEDNSNIETVIQQAWDQMLERVAPKADEKEQTGTELQTQAEATAMMKAQTDEGQAQDKGQQQ